MQTTVGHASCLIVIENKQPWKTNRYILTVTFIWIDSSRGSAVAFVWGITQWNYRWSRSSGSTVRKTNWATLLHNNNYTWFVHPRICQQSKRAKPELVSAGLSRRRLSQLRHEFRRNALSLRGDRNREDQRRIEMRFKFWSAPMQARVSSVWTVCCDGCAEGAVINRMDGYETT